MEASNPLVAPDDGGRVERTPLFATAQADARQIRIAGRALLVFLLLFLAAAPFARVELVHVESFLPLYASARIVIEALTAFLLFALFLSLGTRSILLLASGYLFSVLMAIAHTASFPGVLATAQTSIRGTQITAWLYFIWHGGFCTMLLAYGLMRSERPDTVVQRSLKESVLAVATVCAVAALCVGYLHLGAELPSLMQGHRDSPLKVVVAATTWVLNAAALAVIYLRRRRSVLDLWVIMVAAAWLFDTGLAALLNRGRFDLGWYGGRIYGLLAACFVLVMLLLEYNRLYRQLVQHHVSLRRTSVEQLQIAVTSLSVAQRAAGAGFWDWDVPNGKLTWSDELFHLFGLDRRRDRASFETWERLVHPDDLASTRQRIDDALQGRGPLFNRYRIVRHDGSVRWIDAHGDVVRNAQGEPLHMTGLCIDVTDRVAADEALRESEYFYRQMLESIPGMVFTTRPDGYCDYQSQQWVEYTGVPMSEHQGDGWNALLHPDDRPGALAAWYAAVEGRASYDLEYRVRRRDGVHEWFRVIGRPILDAQGRIVRWFGVAVNIERLKQAEALVAQRSREIEATLEAMPAMVYVKDAQRRYTRVNAAVSEMFGLPVEKMLGRSDEAFLPPELAAAAAESDLAVLGTMTAIKNVEESWHDAGGDQHWVATSKSPFRHEDGSIAGLVGVSIDITEHKHAEARRVQALERQRDALVREVHHRIKNHLQGVIGLLRYKSAGARESESRIELAIAQIASIAQVYGLQGRSDDTHLRLHELIESAIQSAASPVAFEYSPSLRDIVLSQTDAVPLALVINELITNAVKHLATGEAMSRVVVRLMREAGNVCVEVRGGPAQLPSAFDYARRRSLGTGLDLVTVLLPERRYDLRIEQDGSDVVARLVFLHVPEEGTSAPAPLRPTEPKVDRASDRPA